jgi:alpha-L-fucosidase 2
VTSALALISAAKAASYDENFQRHCCWWKIFWQSSTVMLPDKILERHYNLCKYFYGSASRRGCPPMPLQGVWTADDGKLPPWKGDYHHDLNTQMTYWAYLTAGHFEEGRCFLDHLWKQVSSYRKFAREFYAAPGIAVPGICSLAGKALGGWAQYSMSPTASAWLAKMFADYWRYTRDEVFLREQAWPFVSGVGEFLAALLRENGDGQLELPVSTSPEIHNNTPAAFLTPNSNHDLALLRKLFTDIIELGRELLRNEEVERYQKLFSKLPELAIDATAGLKLSPDAILTESHRHHAHLMAIYPLDLLVQENEQQQQIMNNSLLHIDQLGTGMWVGFSFPWMACINARAGHGNRSMMLLETFMRGFLSRNGFNLNGDFKDYGYSWFKYRPFTLEGNFALAQAVHEMLLQSHGGIIRIFPALPESWSDIKFTDLRAEGGFSVSAALSNNQIVSIKISAAKNGILNLKTPLKITKNLICNHPDLDFSAPVIAITMTAGEVLTIELLNDEYTISNS